MRHTRYVIEARNPDGSLSFDEPQPESIWGMQAITGLTENAMSDAIFRRFPSAILTGDSISQWPRIIDARFSARVKTW